VAKAIGIDLGTTNSCVVVFESGVPTVIPNKEGSRTTPSVVGYKDDDADSGEILVGSIAVRQAVQNPERTIRAAKRLIGRKHNDPEVVRFAEIASFKIVASENGDARIGLGKSVISPAEILAHVLKSLKETAERYSGETVSDAVVTVPAYFDEAQRQATKDAGRIAGLNILRIINEPTAAALAYQLDAADRKSKILVYDLGGGTFDVSILELEDGVFRVLSTCGDTHLGGDDFDAALIRNISDSFEAEHGVHISSDLVARERLREACENVKRELSSALESEINLPFLIAGKDGKPLHLSRTIKRSELEDLTQSLVDRTIEFCKKAIEDAELTKKDLSEVVLVGGQTRMPLIQTIVGEFFDCDINKRVDPDEVVAVGAAIQCAALVGQADAALLLDVTPLSLGVQTAGGMTTTIVPRNTTIPTSASRSFSTNEDNQSFVNVRVVQGERPMADDNRLLADFQLRGILPAPRGVPQLEIEFQIDAEGLVTATARDVGTNQSQKVEVHPASGLTELEIEDIINQADTKKQEDFARKQQTQLVLDTETLIYTTEQAISQLGDALSDDVIATLAQDIGACRKSLSSDGCLLLKESYARLQDSSYQIADAFYTDHDQESTENSGDNDNIDAENEVISKNA